MPETRGRIYVPTFCQTFPTLMLFLEVKVVQRAYDDPAE